MGQRASRGRRGSTFFFRSAPQKCNPLHALAVFAPTRRYTPFLVFLITESGVVTPHARNYAICWPPSHTEYRLDCVTGGGVVHHFQRPDV
ncbi:hypothetical protein CKO_05069 [Citrobacter koseri ATCC BAA-895]|uniref:Uncharacterized protein n=1 Tax=Citrobacter koseri (strain ATCC BAA-895 / CDC 4225-83 / SGSC4696) TaxID=290338 RepID=A8ARJ9_CITK8|nr:hypothetical protein CKO_05069 [Citrobacter koseri ATCC BAA-895]